DEGRAVGAVHPRPGDGERLQRAERPGRAAPPLRGAVAPARRRGRGGAAGRRGLPPGSGIRHAAHGRRGPGRGPPAHGARRPGEHPRCDPVPDAPPRARMTAPGSPLLVLLALAVLAALGVVAYNRPSPLELRVALRYLRSRRSSRLLSLITVIAVGGVTVGVTALVFVLGVEPDTGARAVTSLARHFTKGDLRFRTTRPGVEGGLALGTRLASKLSAYPGDVVTLVAAAGSRFNPSLGAFIPRYHRFEVTGLFDTGMYEYDNGYVAMDRRVAQRFADLDKAVTGLEVRLADPWQARAFGLRLETELGYPYRALDWQSQNASLFSALKLEKLAMAVVVFLICVVAAFNVVGTLTMLVRDKTREIGILLAMGLRRTAIRRIFLAQGILIGLTGTSLGVLLGLVLGGMVNQGQWIHIDPSIYFIDHLPVRTQLVDVLAV